MPSYIVSIKKGCSEEEYDAAAKHITESGGKIDYTWPREGLAPGFEVKFPDDAVSTLKSGPHVVGVENNAVVTTQ